MGLTIADWGGGREEGRVIADELGGCDEPKVARLPLNDVDVEEDFEDLGDPVGAEDDEKTNDAPGDAGFALGLGFGIGGVGEHGKAALEDHKEEEEAGKDDS